MTRRKKYINLRRGPSLLASLIISPKISCKSLVMAWTRCSYCHSPAIQQCDCKQHYYCNKDHKKADWKNHMNICMDIRLEAFLTQVANVIQQASLTFVEATNMMLITKIELDDQKVFAYKGVDHGNHSFVKVGDDVFPDEATKHAVLCCNAQFLPLAYMHPLFARMIRSKCSCISPRLTRREADSTLAKAVEIHEVIVKMKPAPQTFIILAEDGTETKNWPADGLALLRITSKQSEKRWYINLSGAEFGLTQSIFSANDFESNHMQALYAVFDFGKCRQYILTCSAMEGWYAHTQRIGLQASSRMKAALLKFFAAAWKRLVKSS